MTVAERDAFDLEAQVCNDYGIIPFGSVCGRTPPMSHAQFCPALPGGVLGGPGCGFVYVTWKAMHAGVGDCVDASFDPTLIGLQ